MNRQNIYEFIKTEEANFKLPIQIAEGMEWNFFDHVRTTILYKNSTYKSGKDDNKPFKNIIRPILNLAYRAEGFDVKDILLYINDSKEYYKSFLVKKFHEVWARQNNIDTFIDDLVESYVDFGGALIKNVNQERPEVVPFSRLAFCDQTDILKGPIAEKHQFAPDELKEMEGKWGNLKKGATGTIDEVITLSQNEKKDTVGKGTKTPGKYIEVYEVHGIFPNWWLDSEYTDEESYDKTYSRQLHIVTFYTSKEGQKNGICLYKGLEKELPYKLVLRDKIYGRALGLGGAEELFEPQVWVNYDVLRMKEMLDVASKIIFQTSDVAFANRNKTSSLENGEILIHDLNQPLTQINTYPVNVKAFENSVAEWEQHARQMGAATESIMGESPTAGTPFKLQELITQESHSLHEYRKGKLATFLDEVYKDWIIPYISREITNGQEFMSELDLEELQQVSDSLVECEANDMAKKLILSGQPVYPEQLQSFKDQVKKDFMKGNKKFIEILKGEMKDLPLDVKVNIAGKQKNLAGQVDKLTNIFRTIISNPQILQNPPMAKLFNEILESSGLSPIDFSGFTSTTPTLAEAALAPKVILGNIPGQAPAPVPSQPPLKK